MIGLTVKLDARPVARALARLPERTRVATAQELNRQRRQSRTLLTRGLAAVLGVKPQKRLRRRIVLPRGARATPRRLVAEGLSLTSVMPGRWFTTGRRGRGAGIDLRLPAGTAVVRRRSMDGALFRVQTGPVINTFTRAGRERLPIVRIDVDTRRPGREVRARVLAELARAWPRRWERRMQRELRRVLRA